MANRNRNHPVGPYDRDVRNFSPMKRATSSSSATRSKSVESVPNDGPLGSPAMRLRVKQKPPPPQAPPPPPPPEPVLTAEQLCLRSQFTDPRRLTVEGRAQMERELFQARRHTYGPAPVQEPNESRHAFLARCDKHMAAMGFTFRFGGSVGENCHNAGVTQHRQRDPNTGLYLPLNPNQRY